MSNSTIEVFTANCELCEEAVRIVKEAVAPCGCSVHVRKADSPEGKKYSVKAAPTVVKDGVIIFCGLPPLDEAINRLRISS